MVIIKRKSIIKINESWNVLINTLNGSLFLLTNKEKDRIKLYENKFFEEKDIIPEDIGLISDLKNHEYICETFEAEDEKFINIVDLLSCLHKKEKEEYVEITLVLTYACNFKCPYCYEGGGADKKEKFMTKEDAKKIIDFYDEKINRLTFFGGEPLLPQNRETIEYVLSNLENTYFNIITNGYYLEEYMDLLKKYNIEMIQVTLDGPENVHNKTRALKEGTGTFKKIIRGIEAALDNNIKVKIRMNISKYNKNECFNLRDELIFKYKNYIDNLFFELQPLFGYNSKDRILLENDIYENDLKQSILVSDNTLRRNTIQLSYIPLISFLSGAKEKYEPIIKCCKAEKYSRFYDSNGDIFSCILAVGKKELSIGKIINNKEVYFDNNMLNRSIITNEKCFHCEYSLICGGGCAFSAFYTNGNINSSYCEKFLDDLYNFVPKLVKQRYGV